MFAVLLLLTLAGVLQWRRAKRPRYLVPVAVLLFLFCWPPVSMLVWRVVQSGYSRRPPAPAGAGAIVVLSGAVHQPFPPRNWMLLGANTFERCSYGAWYYRNQEKLPVLVVGGKVERDDPEPYAEAMKTQVVSAGVPESAIWMETRSRSTAENAAFAAPILKEKGIAAIVLITDAGHMARARRAFEKQAIRVIPAPCGFLPVYDYSPDDFLPSWRAITWNEQLLHEWIGLAWYWARGYI